MHPTWRSLHQVIWIEFTSGSCWFSMGVPQDSVFGSPLLFPILSLLMMYFPHTACLILALHMISNSSSSFHQKKVATCILVDLSDIYHLYRFFHKAESQLDWAMVYLCWMLIPWSRHLHWELPGQYFLTCTKSCHGFEWSDITLFTHCKFNFVMQVYLLQSQEDWTISSPLFVQSSDLH